ncbi:hypothetical protein AeRB84_021180 [Aphanomyces euteiches]|nr:hypothetical protein AeRB84_021180 [Aphanomyces euteiches]
MYSIKRKKPRGLMHFIRCQRLQLVQFKYWTVWREVSRKNVAKRIHDLESNLSQSQTERESILAKVLQLNDTSIELAEEVSEWKSVAMQKEETIKSWQQSCQKTEHANMVLQQQISTLQHRLQDFEQQGRDREHIMEEERNEWRKQINTLEEQNDCLGRKLQDTQDDVLLHQQQLAREKDKIVRQDNEKKKLQHVIDQKQIDYAKLEQTLQNVERALSVERAERQEAALRCKDYEKRLADTVRAIHEHEMDQEAQLRQTHGLAVDMERRWKEQEAKNAELLKLLQEKNNQVAAMTSEIQTYRSVESHRMNNLLEEVQANIIQQKSNFVPQVTPLELEGEMQVLNAHTASIHDDIKSLQQRIKLRLQQKPLGEQRVSTPISKETPQAYMTSIIGSKSKKAKPKAKPKPK